MDLMTMPDTRFVFNLGNPTRDVEITHKTITFIQQPPEQNATRPALLCLPQLAEIDIMQSMDAAGEY
jgi:hypothetical protein